nr:iron chelate uptake ABC transporter family permease subunit [Lolliginicoccus suaedae]
MVVANAGLLAAVLVLLCVNVGRGDFPIGVADVARILAGGGSQVEQFIVFDLRLPRSVVAVLVGAALGLSGAITQSITRNPLASPDILGITAGASSAAVAVIIFGGPVIAGAAIGLPFAAMAGGLLTAALIYFLAWRGGIEGFRLILIGIAVNAILIALTTWMLVLGDIWDVQRATVWLNGSLNGRDWGQVYPVGIALILLGAVLVVAGFQLGALKLGDETAAALGARVQATQAVLLIASVLLAAISVTAAGPIGFVAFVAPQVAMRVLGTAGPPLVGAALMGAALTLGSDVVARTALPVELPVGIVTTAIGGPFLMYMVIRANRRAMR